MKNPNDPSGGGAALGARSDDSSLFSLESLKRSEQEAAKSKKTEDSGLIDLKALAQLETTADKSGTPHVAQVVAPADLFQISVPIAPIAAPNMAAIQAAPAGYEAPRPKSKLPLVIGGVVALVAVGVGVFMLGRSSGEARPTLTPTSTAVAAAPTTTAAAAPADTSASDEPKVAAITPGQRPVKEEAAKADPTTAPTANAAPRTVAAVPRSAPRAQAKKDDAPAPAPKPADTCDLACQMQRAVNKKK
jgi:hypothetical protein